MGGRPPKPVEQHKLEGTYRPCRHDNRASNASLEHLTGVEKPAFLVGQAADAWELQVPELCKLHRVTKMDVPILVKAFAYYQRSLECAKVIEDAGGVACYAELLESGKPDLTIREMQYFEKYEHIMASLFGVTPAGAAKIRTPESAKKDDASDVLLKIIGNG